MEFISLDRNYINIEWKGTDDSPTIDPVISKLISGDIIENDILSKPSRLRKEVLQGILVLSGKSYGRYKNKLLYKCIPNNKGLPSFLIPYDTKIGFSKKREDKLISFKFERWIEKHPGGLLLETIGEVSDINSYAEYLLRCKNVTQSIKPFTTEITTTIQRIKQTDDEIIDNIRQKYNLCDRTSLSVISIDPSGCKDIDDAVGVLHNGSTTILSIYIANVPLIIDYLELWEHIGLRMSTIYLPDRNRPMLPPKLSTDLGSLLAGKRRIAMALDLVIKDNVIIDTTYTPCIVSLEKNYAYEEHLLLNNSMYIIIKSLVSSLNLKYPHVDDIVDSHEVVQWLMICMNKNSATVLAESNKGVFRTLKMNSPPSGTYKIPKEINSIIRTWDSTGSKYTLDTECGHDMMGGQLYTQVTSPIRRIIDFMNMSYLNGIHGINLPMGYITILSTKLDYINEQLKSIKKIQNDITLLQLMGVCNGPYKGFIIGHDSETYTIYFPDIQVISTLQSKENLILYSEHMFTFHAFNDEHTLRRKVRIHLKLNV